MQYARQQSAGIVHLFNFVGSTKAHGDRVDWVNQALFAELLSRVEGDSLESSIRAAVERGLTRAESHGNKPGYSIDREHPEVKMLLGEFNRLDGEGTPLALPARTATATDDDVDTDEGELLPVGTTPSEGASSNGVTAPAVPRKRTRRGSRGGRNRRGGRGRKPTTSSPGGSGTGEAAD